MNRREREMLKENQLESILKKVTNIEAFLAILSDQWKAGNKRVGPPISFQSEGLKKKAGRPPKNKGVQ